MGLDFAVDALYDTGWAAGDDATLQRDASGRAYPTPQAIADLFAAQGLTLQLRHIQLFGCYRAEWCDASGLARGAVVGQTPEEAAVFALAQFRRAGHESLQAAAS